MLSSNNNFSWDMLVLVGVTSYYQVWWLWLSKSERLYSLCQKIVEYVDGIHHPSPPVDWIWDIYDISNQKCCACTRGFIDCPAANDKFGRDVFIHKAWILRSSWWLFFWHSVVSYWCFCWGHEVKDDVILNSSFLHFKLGPDGEFWEMYHLMFQDGDSCT